MCLGRPRPETLNPNFHTNNIRTTAQTPKPSHHQDMASTFQLPLTASSSFQGFGFRPVFRASAPVNETAADLQYKSFTDEVAVSAAAALRAEAPRADQRPRWQSKSVAGHCSRRIMVIMRSAPPVP